MIAMTTAISIIVKPCCDVAMAKSLGAFEAAIIAEFNFRPGGNGVRVERASAPDKLTGQTHAAALMSLYRKRGLSNGQGRASDSGMRHRLRHGSRGARRGHPAGVAASTRDRSNRNRSADSNARAGRRWAGVGSDHAGISMDLSCTGRLDRAPANPGHCAEHEHALEALGLRNASLAQQAGQALGGPGIQLQVSGPDPPQRMPHGLARL